MGKKLKREQVKLYGSIERHDAPRTDINFKKAIA